MDESDNGNGAQAADAPAQTTRREFLTLALVTGSGVALVGVPRPLLAGGGDVPSCAIETLRKIGEIASQGDRMTGKLRGVLKIRNGQKMLPGYTGSQMPMMRYFEGYAQQTPGELWPPEKDKTALLPGPTLRVSVGQRVELTFLNQTDVGAFPGGSIDRVEQGVGGPTGTGCDQTTNAAVTPVDKNWYPGTRGDTFPNCFHASSTANLHFHGTHITPGGFGDNVLVQVRPDPTVTEDKVRQAFQDVFDKCAEMDEAPKWANVPDSFKNQQTAWVENYDLTAIWQGQRGPVDGKSVLPHGSQLAPANKENTDEGLWPEYFVGGYPSCFKVTEAAGHVMGQAPGTHWYHAHKHGSTSINLFNGLAGALIIEGDYDRDLQKIYPGLKQTEKVLVVQVFTDQPNLERGATGGTSATMTNGTQVTGTPQQAPTIVMRPGEIQLWRIINAQVQNRLTGSKFSGVGGASPLPRFRQIAQDGVQFSFKNYTDQPLTTPNNGDGTQFNLAPGGRIDILVQAPQIPADSIQKYELSGIVNLTVCGDPQNDQFPVESNYPVFPDFLKKDIPGKVDPDRHLEFGWEPFRIKNGPASNAPVPKNTHDPSKTFPFEVEVGNPRIGFKKITIAANRGAYWTIDDEQFSEGKFYQTMVLGAEEEWKIWNTTSVAHPFHIHVNPFQVVEVFDPNTPSNSYVRETNGVWHDNVLIPAAKVDTNKQLIIGTEGRAKTPGYIRIRSRFVDFMGAFVLHCHILAHEDRGMMQLVRVIDGRTSIHHH